jgi:hypothetical protein
MDPGVADLERRLGLRPGDPQPPDDLGTLRDAQQPGQPGIGNLLVPDDGRDVVLPHLLP